MSQYNPNKFIEAITNKMNGRTVPDCPYCGGDKYTTTPNVASILIGDDIASLNLGPQIPAGMVICENCGHMEFFALGALGLMDKEGNNG